MIGSVAGEGVGEAEIEGEPQIGWDNGGVHRVKKQRKCKVSGTMRNSVFEVSFKGTAGHPSGDDEQGAGRQREHFICRHWRGSSKCLLVEAPASDIVEELEHRGGRVSPRQSL